MPRIKLFLMRHSKSCCNHIRHDKGTADIPLSQKIRDPALSTEGQRVAKLYGPILRNRLNKAGFDVENAIIASSQLKRAKQTASLVFNRASRPLNYFAENGAIPENTPAGAAYTAPDWNKFVQQLAAITKDGDSVVVVGHGSYLGSLWPKLTGSARKTRLNNLDGILLDISVSSAGITVHKHQELACSLHAKDSGDTCTVADNQKIAVLSKMKGGKRTRRRQRSQRRSTSQKSQRGGMSLGYHQAGAQFQGTSAYPTGTQSMFPTDGPMVRAPLNQTGGFSPAIMGSFASNGAKLIPIATYMGYRMFSNKKKGTTSTRKRKTQHRG